MKSTITISLDTEIIEKLKGEDNYSEVINEEMKAHYIHGNDISLQVLTKKRSELKQLLKESRKNFQILNKKIDKIKKRETETLKLKTISCPQCNHAMRSWTNFYECPTCKIQVMKGGVNKNGN